MAETEVTRVKIPNGATLSEEYTADSGTKFALQMPAALTGTTLTITVSLDGVTYGLMYKQDGTTALPVITFAANRVMALPDELGAVVAFRFTAASAQAAERTLIVTALHP